MPGGSPYHRDEAAIERLYEKLEKLFDHLQDEGCRGRTLSAFADDCISERTPIATPPA
jgi:hypothetical protein